MIPPYIHHRSSDATTWGHDQIHPDFLQKKDKKTHKFPSLSHKWSHKSMGYDGVWPMGSMYAMLYGNIGGILMVNVTIYIYHTWILWVMDDDGWWIIGQLRWAAEKRIFSTSTGTCRSRSVLYSRTIQGRSLSTRDLGSWGCCGARCHWRENDGETMAIVFLFWCYFLKMLSTLWFHLVI